MGSRDEVKLSERERQQLASIEAGLEASDPGLASVLGRRKLWHVARWATAALAGAGGRWAGDRWRRTSKRLVAGLRRAWVGPALMLAGIALVFSTISWQPWFSVPGAVLMGAGLGLCTQALARRFHRSGGSATTSRHGG